MKNINFMTALSISQQKMLNRWWFFSCALGIFSIVLIACLHGFQIYQWYTLSRERSAIQTSYQAVASSMERYEHAQKEQGALQQKMSKCERVCGTTSQITAFFAAVGKACPHATVQSCKWHKHDVELILQIEDPLEASGILEQFQKTRELTHLKLIGIVPVSEQFLVTFRGKK